MNRFFDYFQIAALAFFVIVFVGRTLYLRVNNQVNSMTLGMGKSGLRRLVEIALFTGLLVWILEVLLSALHSSFRLFPDFLQIRLLDSMTVKIIGVGLVLFSFVIFVWALISFGNSWRVGIDEKTPGALVTGGIFAVSRNPIFVFIDLYFIGTFLINGTLILLVFALLVVVSLHYQILQEEKTLMRIHGQAYQEYVARTGRYVSWPPISGSGG